MNNRLLSILRIILLWLATVVAFAIYGLFLRPYAQIQGAPFNWTIAVEGGVIFSGLGISVATGVAIGLSIWGGVRNGHVRKPWAILLLILSSAGGVLTAHCAVLAARAISPWHILQGEGAMAVAITLVWEIEAGIILFLLFTVIILFVKPCSAAPTKS